MLKDALVMYWRYVGDVLVVCWWSVGGVLVRWYGVRVREDATRAGLAALRGSSAGPSIQIQIQQIQSSRPPSLAGRRKRRGRCNRRSARSTARRACAAAAATAARRAPDYTLII